jgi:pimeloyl-ACP methyl ester carboxylesterase
MNKKIKILIIVIGACVLAYGIFYFTDVHHAEKTATDLLNGTDNVSVQKISNGLWLDGPGNGTSLIFYPGAKNEYTAYLPLFVQLAENGVDCYLVEMPLNFAFFGQNSAEPIIEAGNYSHYIMSGHSLGGVSASSYAVHSNKTDAVVLLAAYPTEKIDKPVLSIYGSEDGILNRESYNKALPLISNLTECVIQGGNHAQFAYYGHQDGDNPAKISHDDQQNQTVEIILEFINNVTMS